MIRWLLRWGCLFVLLLGGGGAAFAQLIQVQYFLPGPYRETDRHKLVLQNTSARTVDLSGWLVVTRDYSALIPPGTRLRPGQTYHLAKVDAGGADRPDLVLSQHPGFLIRLYIKQEDGNFAAVFDRNRRFVSGFYYAPRAAVEFLPTRGSLVLPDGSELPYLAPPETHPNWRYFPASDDPAIAFERQGRTWQVVPARGLGRQSTEQIFQQLTARFQKGIVTLKWRFEVENPYPLFILARGKSDEPLQTLDSLIQPRDPLNPQEYVYYDSEVEPEAEYRYRLSYVDPFGQVIRSKLLPVETVNLPVSFRLEVLPPTQPNEAFSVQFYSAFSQEVKLQLYDHRWRELAVLHRNWVEANSQHLLRLTRNLGQGDYTVVATTETGRYLQRFHVQP